MQSAASRRAFGFLASKIHPQLPLTPRESEQLLKLLTHSFRAHLDREHPIPPPERGYKHHSQQLPAQQGRRNASTTRASSSQTSASQHIESILTNPLFAVKPQRRASDPTNVDAQTVLRDPLAWFLDQVATGAAELSKASACLHMLQNLAEVGADPSQGVHGRTKPATQIAEWLKNSGHERSRQFVEFEYSGLRKPFVSMLLQEGGDAYLWRWFTHTNARRVEQTGLEDAKNQNFRAQLLKLMVAAKAGSEHTIDEALAMFLRAHKMLRIPEYGLSPRVLRPAGFHIVQHILGHPQSTNSSELFGSFIQSSKDWTVWSQDVQSILWLHHPTKPSVLTGINYLRDTKCASLCIPTATPKRRKLLVHLCLGSARQCLAENNFADAQFALEFARQNFADLVGPMSEESTVNQEATAQKRQAEEEANLEMLDRLLPT